MGGCGLSQVVRSPGACVQRPGSGSQGRPACRAHAGPSPWRATLFNPCRGRLNALGHTNSKELGIAVETSPAKGQKFKASRPAWAKAELCNPCNGIKNRFTVHSRMAKAQEQPNHKNLHPCTHQKPAANPLAHWRGAIKSIL